MPSGSGEVPSWRCFGGLGAFLRAPAPDDDDDVAIAAARRRPRGTVVVGSGRTNLPRRRADDSSLPLLGWRLEATEEARGAEADAVAVGRTFPRSHLTVNASQGSVRPWPSLPRLVPPPWCELGGPAGRERSLGAVVRLDLDLSAHEFPGLSQCVRLFYYVVQPSRRLTILIKINN